MDEGTVPPLESSAKVININFSQSRKILEKCQTLDSYARFVAKFRELKKDITPGTPESGPQRCKDNEEALKGAIRYCNT
jgi:hypothetical protein